MTQNGVLTYLNDIEAAHRQLRELERERDDYENPPASLLAKIEYQHGEIGRLQQAILHEAGRVAEAFNGNATGEDQE